MNENYDYRYIEDLVKNYSVRNFKKKFLFNKLLAYDNNNIIIKKKNKVININIDEIVFYSFDRSYKYPNMYTVILGLKDFYILFDYSLKIEYLYLILNLYKNNIRFKDYQNANLFIKKHNLNKYKF
jgi:hypothetical protein